MHQRPTNLAVVFAVGSIFAPNQKIHFRHNENPDCEASSAFIIYSPILCHGYWKQAEKCSAVTPNVLARVNMIKMAARTCLPALDWTSVKQEQNSCKTYELSVVLASLDHSRRASTSFTARFVDIIIILDLEFAIQTTNVFAIRKSRRPSCLLLMRSILLQPFSRSREEHARTCLLQPSTFFITSAFAASSIIYSVVILPFVSIVFRFSKL
jgi:hypothetical protein